MHDAKNDHFQVEWGIDLASEHERYLAEEEYKLPTIIYNYPKDIKAFYMRQNDDGKTVAAMDIVCPQVCSFYRGVSDSVVVPRQPPRTHPIGSLPGAVTHKRRRSAS